MAPYSIYRTEPSELGTKAEVKCYAYLTTDSANKTQIEGTLTSLYFSLLTWRGFKESSTAPTVIAIYLFTSKDNAANMPEAWIGMLSKGPSDAQPRISFDDYKLKEYVESADSIKSADEMVLEKLNAYIRKRNKDLCTLYHSLYDLEGETIKKADEKYHNFGAEHLSYQSQLYSEGQRNLFRKYNINDTLSTYITAFGMSYCK